MSSRTKLDLVLHFKTERVDWTGKYGVDDTSFPFTMYVDVKKDTLEESVIYAKMERSNDFITVPFNPFLDPPRDWDQSEKFTKIGYGFGLVGDNNHIIVSVYAMDKCGLIRIDFFDRKNGHFIKPVPKYVGGGTRGQ